MVLPASLRIDAARRRVRLSPTDPAFVQDPYPSYRAIREACPQFFWEDYGHWCCADAATVEALFRDRRLGREPPDGPGAVPDHVQPFYDLDRLSMLEREPPAHTRLRRLVNRAFVSRAIARLRPGIARLAGELLDALPRAGVADLLPAFAEPIPVSVIAELLGVPATDAARLLAWSHSMVAMYRPGRSRADEDAAVAATAAFSAYLRTILAERRARPREDLMSVLANAGQEISEDEAVANAVLLLNAGHEATVHAIGNGVAAVLGSGLDPPPLLRDPEAVGALAEEVLRFDPPLHLFTRYALEPVRTGALDLSPGERVGLLIGAANRDPARWPEPDRFDPLRRPAAHLAFGGGLHFCLGAPLARLEIEIALPLLFARYPRLALAEPPRYADRYHFRGLAALNLVLA